MKVSAAVSRAQQHENHRSERSERGKEEEGVVGAQGRYESDRAHERSRRPANGLVKNRWQEEGRKQRRTRPNGAVDRSRQPFSAMTA
jgi:hypothetical protein